MRTMPPITQFPLSKLETLYACPYCGCAETRYLFVERGFPYVECRECGLIFLATRVKQQNVGEIYDNEGYHSDQPTRATRRTAEKRAALLGSLPRGAKVIEDGAGNGLFVAACRARGFDATGCDLGADAVAKAAQVAGVELVHGTLASLGLAAASRDAVACFNLLSHLYEPWAYVREVSRLLRPGGIWLTRVGDRAGWKKRMGRGDWSAPEHVFHYPLDLVQRMAAEAGLRCEYSRPAFDSDFPNLLGKVARAVPGAGGRALAIGNQVLLRTWLALKLPRDDYYLRFRKRAS
jgi:SAM-dependent methyltransferase